MTQIETPNEVILDSIADGVFTVDLDWRITSFNRAAERITGVRREEAVGRYCWEIFRASICEQRCSLHHTLKGGRPVINQSIFIVNARGERVPISISTAILRDVHGQVIGGAETFRDLSIVEALRKEISGRHSFHDIISKNKDMQRLFAMLQLVSESDVTVLLEGESGTGKELFAHALHSLSPRRKAPLVTVNCGALPDTLLESELFGYKAGAFTDAKKDKPGRLALAQGGTLFLDEIGDVSPALQVRLLRVLQDKTYEPLGGTRPRRADVRIVAATHRNLEKLAQEGRFRRDLYYRINVVKLVLPPLRRRKEDIPLLADHFIRKFNKLTGKSIEGLSPDVLPLLLAHDYPGNVRELENIIEYATVICRGGRIGIEHLPEWLRASAGGDEAAASPAGTHSSLSLRAMERAFLYEALRRNQWNRKETARQLGIHPSTLWRRIKRLGLEIPKAEARRS